MTLKFEQFNTEPNELYKHNTVQSKLFPNEIEVFKKKICKTKKKIKIKLSYLKKTKIKTDRII